MKPKTDDKPKLGNLKACYYQNEDCCGPTGEAEQEIEIEAVDNGTDFYLVITTERWAIDDPEGMTALLKDFDRRLK